MSKVETQSTPKRSAIKRVLSNLKNRVICLDLQNIYELREPMEQKGNAFDPADLTYSIHDNEDVLPLIEQVNPLGEHERGFAKARLIAGDRAIIARLNEVPVFYGWLMFEEIEMTYGIFNPLPKGCAFAYNLFAARSYRRRGAMSKFYQFACHTLFEQNYHTLYVGIARGNKRSIVAHLNSGFERIGYFYSMELFGKSITLAKFRHARRFYVSRR